MWLPLTTPARSVRLCLPLVAAGAGLILLVPAAARPAGLDAFSVTDLNNGVTAGDLAQELAGKGVTISNVTFTGDNRAAGIFTGGESSVGFDSGIVLDSGAVETMPSDGPCSQGVEGPNTCYEGVNGGSGGSAGGANSTDFGLPGDSDLTALAGYDTYDAAVLEFDFVPKYSTVQFSYVFASEEYSDYVNTEYDDVFGFFVNGQNCALVPGTTDPVSVNSINDGNDNGGDPTADHPELFRDNVLPDGPTIDSQFDGLTTTLTCTASVSAGVVNHMKLAIADASDQVLDSGVFIEAGSFHAPRYVAFGDSVPYGHGLANPYPDSRPNFPSKLVSQPPSLRAYPGIVAHNLQLSMLDRSTNCGLTGDDLAVSGAAMAASDSTSGNNQCSQYSTNVTVGGDEVPAANLAQNHAQLVSIQAGADDINFSACLLYEVSKDGFHVPIFTHSCVSKNAVTTGVANKLKNVTDALKTLIEEASPYATEIAVLNYYNPVPNPDDFDKGSIFPSGKVDPLCWGLSHNESDAYKDSVVIQRALNAAIAAGVSQARSDGITNVTLVNISSLEKHHEMCTGKPAIFSGEPMSKSSFYSTLAELAISKKARVRLQDETWRAAHPNRFGQMDIAQAVTTAPAP